MNPLLLELPMPIKTNRLLIRPFMPYDGKELNTAINESFDELHYWMPWAHQRPSIEESELFVRQSYADWIVRKELNMAILDPHATTIIGATGYNSIDWSVPSFQIGYWVRKQYGRQGFITESTNALVRYAFDVLHAVRIEIRCDEDNLASIKVAQRLGFLQEARLHHNMRKSNDNSLRNTLIYTRHNTQNLPDLIVHW